MEINEKVKPTEELSVWNIGRTAMVRYEYGEKTVMETCKENMDILMNKINELVIIVNQLRGLHFD